MLWVKNTDGLAAVIGKECSRDFVLLNTGGTAEIFMLRPLIGTELIFLEVNL